MDTILRSILVGNFEPVLENIKTCSCNDLLQVLRYSARRAFDSNTVCPQLLNVVNLACSGLLSSATFDLTLYMKALFHIVQVACKKEEVETCYRLFTCISPIANKCLEETDTHLYFKSLYQVVWNFSLTVKDSSVSIQLQKYSLIFLLIAAPDAIEKASSLAEMVVKNFQTRLQSNDVILCKSSESSCHSYLKQTISSFYEEILNAMFNRINIVKKLECSETVAVVSILSSCNVHTNSKMLVYSLKTLKGLVSSCCYSAIYTGLQVLQSCLNVRDSKSDSSVIDKKMAAMQPYFRSITTEDTASVAALTCLLSSCAAVVDSQDEQKIFGIIVIFMKMLVGKLRLFVEKDSDSNSSLTCLTVESLFTRSDDPPPKTNNQLSLKALCELSVKWCSLAENLLRQLLPMPLTNETNIHYHSLGVSCGNLGVLCYRAGDYTSAVPCLKACIALQDSYVASSPAESDLLVDSIQKKKSLLFDALRYTCNYKEAAQCLSQDIITEWAIDRAQSEAPEAVRLKVDTVDVIISQWMKLKRDASKSSDKTIHSMTLSQLLLNILVNNYRENESTCVKNATELTQLVLKEHASYVKASWDCNEEELCCAEVLLTLAFKQLELGGIQDPALLMLVARSLLIVARILYSSPDRSIPDNFTVDNIENKLKSFSSHFEYKKELTNCELCKSEGILDEKCMTEACSRSLMADSCCPSLTVLRYGCAVMNMAYDKLIKKGRNSRDVPAQENWTEIVAELNFWMFLSLCQKYLRSKEKDVSPVCSVSLTAAAADLGEEQQPDDECDVRSNIAPLLHSFLHRHALKHLDSALNFWTSLNESALQSSPSSSVTLSLIGWAGHIYRLHGCVSKALRSFALLVKVSRAVDNHHSLVFGLTEMIWCCPESCGSSVYPLLSSALLKVGNSKNEAHLVLLAKVALALSCLVHGKLSEGWELMQQVLQHEIAEKKTARATEVLCLAHFVASRYSLLSARYQVKAGFSTALNPVALAQIAARQGLALFHSLPDSSGNCDFHWNERVAWLHFMTSAWLARLSLLTVQPRLARAYLKQPFSLAHKMVLPFRAAQVLSLLAEVDLICDQVDDCRVKVDALISLFLPQKESISCCASPTSSYPKKSPLSRLIPAKFSSRKLALVNDSVLRNEEKPNLQVKNSKRQQLGKENKLHGNLKSIKNCQIPNIKIESIRNVRISRIKSSPVHELGREYHIDASDANDDGLDDEEFIVRDAQAKLGDHQLIGVRSKLAFLGLKSTRLNPSRIDRDKSLCPESPSLTDRDAELKIPPWRHSASWSFDSEKIDDVKLFLDAKCDFSLLYRESELEEDAVHAFMPGFGLIFLNTAVMLAALHRIKNRFQSATECIDRALSAYESMTAECRRQFSSTIRFLSEHAVVPFSSHPQDFDRLEELFVVNTFISDWCKLQESRVQLFAAQQSWDECCHSVLAALRMAFQFPAQSVIVHQSSFHMLLLQKQLLKTILTVRASQTGIETPESSLMTTNGLTNSLSPRPSTITPTHLTPANHLPPPIRRSPLGIAAELSCSSGWSSDDHRSATQTPGFAISPLDCIFPSPNGVSSAAVVSSKSANHDSNLKSLVLKTAKQGQVVSTSSRSRTRNDEDRINAVLSSSDQVRAELSTLEGQLSKISLNKQYLGCSASKNRSNKSCTAAKAPTTREIMSSNSSNNAKVTRMDNYSSKSIKEIKCDDSSTIKEMCTTYSNNASTETTTRRTRAGVGNKGKMSPPPGCKEIPPSISRSGRQRCARFKPN